MISVIDQSVLTHVCLYVHMGRLTDVIAHDFDAEKEGGKKLLHTDIWLQRSKSFDYQLCTQSQSKPTHTAYIAQEHTHALATTGKTHTDT